MLQVISSRIASQFPLRIRERGGGYQRAGVVKIEEGASSHVEASVRGSHTYKVSLDLIDDNLHVDCTCAHYESAGVPCKHIWATIMEAEAQGHLADARRHKNIFVMTGDEDEDFDEANNDDENLKDDSSSDADLIRFFQRQLARQSASARGLPLTLAKPKKITWEDIAQSVGNETSTATLARRSVSTFENRSIAYVINAVPKPHSKITLSFSIMWRERRVNGNWGDWRTSRMSASDISSMPLQTDRTILTLCHRLRGGILSSYYYHGDWLDPNVELDATVAEHLLPRIFETGRVHLLPLEAKTPIGPFQWLDGAAWRLTLTPQPSKRGNVNVIGFFERDGVRLPLDAPQCIHPAGLVFHDGALSRFDNASVFPWISFLKKEGSFEVSAKKIDRFLQELIERSPKIHWDAPESLRVETLRVKPSLRLRLAKPKEQNGGHERIAGELIFEYGDESVSAADHRSRIVLAEKRVCVERDPEEEEKARVRLTAAGFRRAPYYRGENALPEIPPKKVPRVVMELIREGWRVEAEGRIYRQPGQFNFTVTSGIDWFELEGAADYGEARASLPALLAAMKRGENFVTLDDGTFGVLPEEWLRKYGRLAAMGETQDDGRLVFKRTQTMLLDALLAEQADVAVDADFDRVRAEIRSFERIEPRQEPKGFKTRLRPYQRDALGWFDFLQRFGFGGCLADDMGLGKTVMVLALLDGRRAAGDADRPSLVVAPKSVVFNWREEAARFAPKLRILEHVGTNRLKDTTVFEGRNLVLTTYDLLARDVELFKDFSFDYVVLDEAQAAKNATTIRAKAVRLLRGRHRLALSGTPIENHIGELWTLFDFLNPGMLGAAAALKRRAGSGDAPEAAEDRALLARAIQPFMLRRTKQQVVPDLPRKTEQTIHCELTPEERRLYNELRDHYRASLSGRIERDGLGRSQIFVLEALLRLRQAACHPGLIDKKRVRDRSAKLDAFLEMIEEIMAEGHKALVFSQFTSMLAIVRAALDAKKIRHEYLDGQTRDRQERVERFQTDATCQLFLISLKAGGLGLNLTAADYVFILDPWWNPAAEAQAVDRTHRIGQKKPVFAYRLITSGTVEEKVLELQTRKRDLAAAIITQDASLMKNLTREDLEILLG